MSECLETCFQRSSISVCSWASFWSCDSFAFAMTLFVKSPYCLLKKQVWYFSEYVASVLNCIFAYPFLFFSGLGKEIRMGSPYFSIIVLQSQISFPSSLEMNTSKGIAFTFPNLSSVASFAVQHSLKNPFFERLRIRR